jgi:hypothetical protein
MSASIEASIDSYDYDAGTIVPSPNPHADSFLAFSTESSPCPRAKPSSRVGHLACQ